MPARTRRSSACHTSPQAPRAVVVRVVDDAASAATLTLAGSGRPAGALALEASSAGAWGNRLSAAVDYDTDRALPRTPPPSSDSQRFNLAVRYQPRAGRDE